MTDLDKQLQEIATKNWKQFAALMGKDAIRRAKICLLRGKELSYSQISIRLDITEHQARYGCHTCPTPGEGDNDQKGC